jgi:peptide/nickel transport system substrate-binding protein
MRAVRPSAVRRLRLGAALGFAAAVLSVAAAGAALAESPTPSLYAEPSASPGAEQVVYRYGTLENVDNLNPFIGYSGVDYMIYQENYDFLVGFEPTKLQPRPEFAESWSHSDDGLVWTFKIRPGMKWQDGQAATARDVAFTFNYNIENGLSAFASYLTYIKKATALDDLTVQIECTKPKGDILSMKVPILPEHVWSKVSKEDAETAFENGPPCIGTGPFEVVEHKPNNYTRLAANPYYWGGKPALDEILVITYQNADTMVQDLKSGALDGAIGVPPAQFPGLASDTITTNACVSWSFEQLTFNCYDSPDSKGNPVLLDPAFRQALQYAVDRDKNATTAYSGFMDPAGVLLPPYSAYYWEPSSDQTYTYDPAKAQQLLEDAGYKDVNGDGYRETKDGKALKLRLFTDAQTPENVSTSKLTAGWLKAVGVKTELRAMDPDALANYEANWEGDTFRPDFDLVIWWWQGDADPQFILSLLTKDQIGWWSDTSWTNPEYEQLFQQESTSIDPEARKAAIQRMQEIAYQESPYVIFGYFQFLEAFDSGTWDGYVHAPSGYPGYNGGVFNRDTWTSLKPATVATAEGGETSPWTYVVIVVIAVVVVVLTVVLLRRRGSPTEE